MNEKRKKIIIVDDAPVILNIAESALSEKYDVFTAMSGAKLFSLMKNVTPDMILLDVEMPNMNGYEVIKVLKDSPETSHIPVIFLTGRTSPRHEVLGLNLGAVDYVTKPFSSELLLKRVDLHMLFERQRHELLKNSLRLEDEVDKKTRTVMELQTTILKAIAELVECRDHITGGHIERTQNYLNKLIRLVKSCDHYIDELADLDLPLLIVSSQLHDVGKISIKDSILLKKGPLTVSEWEEMKKHATYGVEIIKKIERSTSENAFLQYAQIFAGTHHERWDGNGYPNGLEGERIPLLGRLMALVDVYDALTNERPYKKAYTHERAVEIIREGLGTQFDPVICKVFLDNHQLFKTLDSAYDESISEYLSDLNPTVAAVTNAMGVRSGNEDGHVEKVQRYLDILFDAMLEHEALSQEVFGWNKDRFLTSAHLYDVGELSVSDEIFNKEDSLTDEERLDLREHTRSGATIVQMIKDNIEADSLLHHAEMLAGTHHEKWDGTGYPQGLKGKGIPIEGRLMAIVDVYNALTSDRPHRKRLTHTAAVNHIKEQSSSHFDPDIVEVFLKVHHLFKDISGA